MIESYREHRPLLYEDYSDDEQRYLKVRPMNIRGRARNKVKGAASILTRWPDHWSSSFLFWWMLIGVIALLTMVLYNIVVAFALIPGLDLKMSLPYSSHYENYKNDLYVSTVPSVFMHILADNNEEVNLEKYLPSLEYLSEKYHEFDYNVVMLLNDVSTELRPKSEEENNIEALTSVLKRNKPKSHADSKLKNIKIHHIFLSEYMEDSPVRGKWRNIPKQLMPFIIKAVSIWEKGGITFDPILLTNDTPNPIYRDKLEAVFEAFTHHDTETKVILPEVKIGKEKQTKAKKRLNNIQDIINALENDDNLSHNQYNLTEAENRPDVNVKEPTRKLMSVLKKSLDNKLDSTENDDDEKLKGKRFQNYADRKTDKKMFSKFLAHLFKGQNDTTVLSINTPEVVDVKHIEREKRKEVSEVSYNSSKDEIQNKIITENKDFEITVDVKGNILAAKAKCHAFLGSVFTNIGHYSQDENIDDFVLSELSSFCNGLLSSCKGVNVILV